MNGLMTWRNPVVDCDRVGCLGVAGFSGSCRDPHDDQSGNGLDTDSENPSRGMTGQILTEKPLGCQSGDKGPANQEGQGMIAIHWLGFCPSRYRMGRE